MRACDESPRVSARRSRAAASEQQEMAQIVAGDAKAVGKHKTPVNIGCLTSILCAGVHSPTLVEEMRYY